MTWRARANTRPKEKIPALSGWITPEAARDHMQNLHRTEYEFELWWAEQQELNFL